MKTLLWILLVAVVVAAPIIPLVAKAKEPAIEVRKVSAEDDELDEEWQRVTAEPDVLGVGAVRHSHAKWKWQILINAAEFVRRDPLASRLDADITAALRQVKGVTDVVREDTEVWLVQGDASGGDLVRSCAKAIDQLAPAIRKHIEDLSR